VTSNVNHQILESQKLFNKILDKAGDAYAKEDFNSVIAWAKIAAHFAFVRHPGFFVSPELERLLLRVAQKIENQAIPADEVNKRSLSRPTRFLHVVTECYETGGHSAFLDRWIKTTNHNSIHSLVSTANIQPIPENLVKSIKSSGGWCCSLPETSQNLIDQGSTLRQLARNWADLTVLFIQPFDPLPIVAFGVKDVPPVVFCNHADHAFWLGASITDVLANYHYYGTLLCSERRGLNESKTLPIPLIKKESVHGKDEARKDLGLQNDDTMLLTIGRVEKFFPFLGYDFLEVMTKLLQKHPKLKLFAVGPADVDKWNEASKAVDGRIIAVGMVDQSRLETFYAAADVYVPGFPCGSGTALLEAGLQGIPIVGLHAQELPYLSVEDDVSFERLNVYVSSISEFLETLELMISNPNAWRQRALTVKENIEREHCNSGWDKYLTVLLKSLPSQHSIKEPKPAKFSDLDCMDQYLSKIDSYVLNNELLEHSLARLIRVYSKNLKKREAIEMQASLLKSITKSNNLQQSKSYVSNFIDTLKFIF
jgi:glycosyltransferase involved in cell wall biosynthesis